ncbi:hypothetical protein CLV58_109129 [Spirosoma oryzae]|uniref:Uncharacterized protein n=1 Tax=Spirosoma oryzae TaxID=1469603 RepID=A0A2T0SYA5_9BACT|nr:hypothetical protein [Spirosoma oryzae]PRY38402.1 hypothetical protein CLV58_109129 [Spirosoma oryzae]
MIQHPINELNFNLELETTDLLNTSLDKPAASLTFSDFVLGNNLKYRALKIYYRTVEGERVLKNRYGRSGFFPAKQ